MAYNGYSNQGYGQLDPYAHDVEANPNMELTPLTSDSKGGSIFDKCKAINTDVAALKSKIANLESVYRETVSATSTVDALRHRADDLSYSIRAEYRALIERAKDVKRTPGASQPQYAAQINMMERNLQDVITTFQKVEKDFRAQLRQQAERQLTVARVDYSAQDIDQLVDNPTQQVFSQALLRSDRSGQANQVRGLVQARNVEMQKIERDFVELSQLFQDLQNLVIQQEPAVDNIHQQTENVHQDLTQGNAQVDRAKKTAYARNKKKWWCLLIVILIIIIIGVVVGCAVGITVHNNSNH